MNEEERKRFEQWIERQPIYQGTDKYPDEPGVAFRGEYKSYSVQLAWQAWQEAIGGER